MSNKTRVKLSNRQREAADKGGVYSREKKRVQGFLGRLEQERQKQTKGVYSNGDIGTRQRATARSQSSLTSRQGVIRKTRQ